jgi:hypothetical protein
MIVVCRIASKPKAIARGASGDLSRRESFQEVKLAFSPLYSPASSLA